MKQLILFIILLYSCKPSQEFYDGYVYYDKKPVGNVMVKENRIDKNINTKTDSTGYFILPKNSNSLSDLVFIKDGVNIDTVKTVWTQHGEKIKYTFLNKKKDTLF